MQASQYIGNQSSQGAQQAQPMTAIDRLNAELQNIGANINSLCQRCDSISIRHLGSEPAPAAQGSDGSKLSPVPVGTFGEAASKIMSIHASIKYLETLVARIEQI